MNATVSSFSISWVNQLTSVWCQVFVDKQTVVESCCRGSISRKQVQGFFIFQLRALIIQLGFNFDCKILQLWRWHRFCVSVYVRFWCHLGLLEHRVQLLTLERLLRLIGRSFQEFRGILGCFCVYIVLDYPAPHLNGRLLQIVCLNLFVSLQVR